MHRSAAAVVFFPLRKRDFCPSLLLVCTCTHTVAYLKPRGPRHPTNISVNPVCACTLCHREPSIHHSHKGDIFWLWDVSLGGISNHDKSRLSTMSCSFAFSFVRAWWLPQWKNQDWAHQMLKPVFICVHGNEATISYCVWIHSYFMGVILLLYSTAFLFIGSACSFCLSWLIWLFGFILFDVWELFLLRNNAVPPPQAVFLLPPFVKQFAVLLICKFATTSC